MCEIDEQVTSDVKRLIRTPGSLHGKSSLRVVPMTVKELNDFNPLVKAVAFDDDPVRITMNNDQRGVKFMENTYDLTRGAGMVGKALAIHLMCKGHADYTP
jgi:DNA primase small subunit